MPFSAFALRALGPLPAGGRRGAHAFSVLRTLLYLLALSLQLSACGTDEIVAGPAVADANGTSEVLGDISNDSTALPDIGQQDAGADVWQDVIEPTDLTEEIAVVDVGPGGCPSDHCAIGDQCLAKGSVNPLNSCQFCLPLASEVTWSAADSATCDDGNACTNQDHCDAGQCVGTASLCDDANGCTTDSCDNSGNCVHLPKAATCDDANVCTVGDACGGGVCLAGSQTLSCDDGNPCTFDSCLPVATKVGDVWLPAGCRVDSSLTSPCDDGNACTAGDQCAGGVCLPGMVSSCDDQSLCTIDSCDAKTGCAHQDISKMCQDSNPCTDEACDPGQGCVFPFNTKPCDDINACTSADTCSQGACIGQAVPVQDGNLCTDDSCDSKVGVLHMANALPCDDGNACTLQDVCALSQCQPGLQPLVCDDKNPCTDDSCDPKQGCVFQNNTTPCDDGSACTAQDTCQAGACVGQAVDCNDKNDCTTDSCDPKQGCKHALIVSNACRPVITVDYPPRAATIAQPGPLVTVKGHVVSGAGPITQLSLNGQPLAVGADGSFSQDVQSKIGGNTLVFDATDSFGSAKKRVQAYLWSTSFYKPDAAQPGTGMVDPGLGFWLSQLIIDSGVHDQSKPKDLATIFEIVIKSLNIGSLLTNPVYNANNLTVDLTNLKYDPATVTLKSQPGSLHLTATIANVTGDLNANYKVCVIGCFNVPITGKLTMSSIVISSDMVPSVKPDHTLQVKLLNSSVALNNMQLTLSNPVVNFLLGGVMNAVLGMFKSQLESAFASQIAASLEPTLANALGALAIQTNFGINKLDGSGAKVMVQIQTDFSAVQVSAPGAEFDLRARAMSVKTNPYDNLGVPARVGCAAAAQKLVVLQKSPLELVVADDAFNELLWATWNGGLFEFPVPASMLGSVDLSKYGVSDLQMTVSAMLAPTMSDCGNGDLVAHIGDFKVTAKLNLLGQPMDVVMYATFTAGVTVLANNGQLGISLTDVKSADLEVDVQQDNMVSSEGVLGQLVKDNLINGLVAQLGGSALGAFPIPAIDLSAAAKLPPGTAVIAINPKGVTRKDGNSIVGGDLQ